MELSLKPLPLLIGHIFYFLFKPFSPFGVGVSGIMTPGLSKTGKNDFGEYQYTDGLPESYDRSVEKNRDKPVLFLSCCPGSWLLSIK